jgi:hypothetical protein
MQVANPSAEHMEGLVDQIIRADYSRVEQQLLSKNIRLFVDHLKQRLHITWSFRTVRRFLRRVNDFVGFRPKDPDLPYSIEKISVTDVTLSFVLSLMPLEVA